MVLRSSLETGGAGVVSLCVVQGRSRPLEEMRLTQAPQLHFYSSGILALLTLEGEFSALGVRYR